LWEKYEWIYLPLAVRQSLIYFGMGTTEPVAKEYETTVLTRVPIEPAIREGGDSGNR